MYQICIGIGDDDDDDDDDDKGGFGDIGIGMEDNKGEEVKSAIISCDRIKFIFTLLYTGPVFSFSF